MYHSGNNSTCNVKKNDELTDHLSVAGLLVDDGDVLPAEHGDELHHGGRLVRVGRDGAQEVGEALERAQAGARREEAHLPHTTNMRTTTTA